MFFAAFWILCSHSIGVVGAEQWPFLMKLKPLIAFGWGGVDIFFFLSGLGIGLSLSKNPSFSIFISKRFNRIFCSFFLIVTVEHIVNGTRTVSYLLDVSTISYWLPLFGEHSKNTFWYVSAAFAFYLLSYPYYRIFCKKPFVSTVVIVLLGLALYKLLFGKIDFFLGRIPIYFMGMYASRWVNTSFKTWPFVLLASIAYCVMALIAWRYGGMVLSGSGLHFILFMFITPGLVFFLSNVFKFMDRFKLGSFVDKQLACLGKYSLEIYLVHWSFICMIKQFDWKISWILFVIVSIVLAWVVKKLADGMLAWDKIRCKD